MLEFSGNSSPPTPSLPCLPPPDDPISVTLCALSCLASEFRTLCSQLPSCLKEQEGGNPRLAWVALSSLCPPSSPVFSSSLVSWGRVGHKRCRISPLCSLSPLSQFPPGLKEAKENRALLRLPLSGSLSLPAPGRWFTHSPPPPPPWQNLALVSGFCRAPRVKRLGSHWTLYFSPVHPSPPPTQGDI